MCRKKAVKVRNRASVFFMALLICLFMSLSVSASCFADSARTADDKITSAGILTDMLVIRPIGLATTIGGIGLFTVTLPFTACKGEDEIQKMKEHFIVKPGKYTFVRPVGDFSKPTEFPE